MASIGEATLEQRVLRFIEEKRLLSGCRKLVVAVSGGPDSVCLLHVLVSLQGKLGIELHVAHLNHRLRGAESEADARYVAGLARRLGVPATIESRDVKAYRVQHRASPEEAAREVRYAFLARVAASVGAERVAVGHTLDDHVETILMHLLRGSGSRGLRGLLPISQRPTGSGLTVVRPLLEVSREATATYCRHHRLRPRLDASNLSRKPRRNRVRHDLLPRLRAYNPQITEALLRTARLAADDLAFIDDEATRLWGRVARKEGKSVIFDKQGFTGLPAALKRSLLRASVERLGSLKDIESGHIEEVLAALDKPAGKVIGMPGGLNFTMEYDRFVLSADAAALSPFPALEGEHHLNVPGESRLPGWDVEAAITDPSEVKVESADSFIAYFDLKKVGEELTVRHRLPGDRFQPLGMGLTKKLNAFMIDARIPRVWRQRIPIVCTPAQIIWVVGWRPDDRVKVTANTEKVLRLKFKRC